jgi:hypothetical protein
VARPLVVIAAFLCLAVPAALAAPPADKGKPESPGNSAAAPGQSAEKNAAKKCKTERAAGAAAFKARYGSKGLGKCIAALKQKAGDDDEAKEDDEAEENAAKKCKKERDDIGAVAFKNRYAPTNHPNGANAFGKCVSKLAKAQNS